MRHVRGLRHVLEGEIDVGDHLIEYLEEHRPPDEPESVISSINTPHMQIVAINAEGYHHVHLLLLAECLSGLLGIGALLSGPFLLRSFSEPTS